MKAYGTEVLARTLSKLTRHDRQGNAWNYHSRSDHHSKVACWGIVFDLMRTCSLLRTHVAAGKVVFGINHEMSDFRNDRKKNLDLVICQPAIGHLRKAHSLTELAAHYEIELTKHEREELAKLPLLRQGRVGGVLVALEAKACMTAHQKALPRLYDELNSSHQTVHGSNDLAIAAGFVMVNIADTYLSPDLNKKNRQSDPEWTKHNQPRSAQIAVDKIKQLPRRSKPGMEGYDALAVVVVECVNDGSPVQIHADPPAPPVGDTYHYGSMIDRLSTLYATRFTHV